MQGQPVCPSDDWDDSELREALPEAGRGPWAAWPGRLSLARARGGAGDENTGRKGTDLNPPRPCPRHHPPNCTNTAHYLGAKP